MRKARAFETVAIYWLQLCPKRILNHLKVSKYDTCSILEHSQILKTTFFSPAYFLLGNEVEIYVMEPTPRLDKIG